MTKINTSPQYDYNNVLIRPKRSDLRSRSEVDLTRKCTFKYGTVKWEGVPLIAANMDTTGTFNVYEVLSKHNILTAMNKFYTKEDYMEYMSCDSTDEPATNFGSIQLRPPKLDPNLFMVSTGISDADLEQLQGILSVIECNWICIDIANGYIKSMVDFCKRVRELYPTKIIVGGNVATREMVEELILNGGVDVVKVGIGPGSACSTRLKTGVGVPQLSAVMECADAAHGVNGHIIADGGITCPGDVAKALGGGADFVMLGGQFAGHKENPGKLVNIDGKFFKSFYGMSSKKAQKTHYGKMDKYRASEGRELMIPYKGELNDTVGDYLGGLRSTCTYIGAKNIKDMPKCTTFGLTTQQVNTHFI
jgi:GMP reductase